MFNKILIIVVFLTFNLNVISRTTDPAEPKTKAVPSETLNGEHFYTRLSVIADSETEITRFVDEFSNINPDADVINTFKKSYVSSQALLLELMEPLSKNELFDYLDSLNNLEYSITGELGLIIQIKINYPAELINLPGYITYSPES